MENKGMFEQAFGKLQDEIRDAQQRDEKRLRDAQRQITKTKLTKGPIPEAPVDYAYRTLLEALARVSVGIRGVERALLAKSGDEQIRLALKELKKVRQAIRKSMGNFGP